MVFVGRANSVTDKIAICEMLKDRKIKYSIKAKGISAFRRILPSEKISWFNIYVMRKDAEKACGILTKAGYTTARFDL